MSFEDCYDLSFSTREAFMASLSQKERFMVCWLFARGGYASLRELLARTGRDASRVSYRLQMKGIVEFYDKKFRGSALKSREFITLHCTDFPGHPLEGYERECVFLDPEWGLSFLARYGVSPVSVSERRYSTDLRGVRFLGTLLANRDITEEQYMEDLAKIPEGLIHFARFRREDLLRVIKDVSSWPDVDVPYSEHGGPPLVLETKPLVRFLSRWGIDDHAHHFNNVLEVYSVPASYQRDPWVAYIRSWGRHGHVGRPSRYVCLTSRALELCKRLSSGGYSEWSHKPGSSYARRFVFSRAFDLVYAYCDYLVGRHGIPWKIIGGEDDVKRAEYFRWVGSRLNSVRFTRGAYDEKSAICFGVVARNYSRDFAFKVFGTLYTLAEIKRVLGERVSGHPYMQVNIEMNAARKAGMRGDLSALERYNRWLKESGDGRESYYGVLTDLMCWCRQCGMQLPVGTGTCPECGIGDPTPGYADRFPFTLEGVFDYIQKWYACSFLFRWFNYSDSRGHARIHWPVFFLFLDFLLKATKDYNLLFCFCPWRLDAFEGHGIEVATRSLRSSAARLPGSYWRYI